ncbi:hypothetical protein Bca101_080638 [Brassica carinata]
MAEKDEELSLFLEMRRRQKEQDSLLVNNPHEFETPLGSKAGTSPVFNIPSGVPARKTDPPDDFLKHTGRNHLTSRHPSSPGASQRPSSSEGPRSRPATPTGRSSTLTTNSKTSRPSTPTSRTTVSSTTRPSITDSAMTKPTPMSRPTSSYRLTPTASKPTTSTTRPAGSTARSTTSTATKSAGPSRSTTPLSRSSTPTSRPTLPPTKTISRSATPTRRPSSSASTTAKPTVSQIKPMPTPSKTHAVSPAASPTVRSRPWKPSDMPGFSLETPPNLRTKLPERPLSATRGRPGGAPSPRSNAHHQEEGHRCTLVVALFLLLTVDTPKPMTMINMRKLAPPRLDEKGSPHGNLSAKSFITR